MKVYTSIALLLVAAVVSVNSHKFRFGPCKKNVVGLKNFDPTKMNGIWYVLKKTATSSTCMSVVFNVTANYLEMREIRTPTSITPFSIIVTNIGKLTQKGSEPSVMDLKWDNVVSSVIGTTYTILDTDYTTFAVDYECQDLFLARRQSGTIISRNKTLSKDTMKKAEDLLAAQGIDISSMNNIDHSTCFDPANVDYNIIVDEDGVRAGLVDEEGKIITLIETPEQLEEVRRKVEEQGKQ